ncbi:Oxygen sensor histidine kinase NreB [compost metagenome]
MLDDTGLLAGIGWQAKEFQKRTGIRCRVKLPADGAGFGSDLSINAFRIFQEILTNVARHAKATRVEVALNAAPDRLVLEVADNGVGISASKMNGKGSLGLLGMRERALRLGGEVNIAGARRRGTRITVSLPRGEEGT